MEENKPSDAHPRLGPDMESDSTSLVEQFGKMTKEVKSVSERRLTWRIRVGLQTWSMTSITRCDTVRRQILYSDR